MVRTPTSHLCVRLSEKVFPLVYALTGQEERACAVIEKASQAFLFKHKSYFQELEQFSPAEEWGELMNENFNSFLKEVWRVGRFQSTQFNSHQDSKGILDPVAMITLWMHLGQGMSFTLCGEILGKDQATLVSAYHSGRYLYLGERADQEEMQYCPRQTQVVPYAEQTMSLPSRQNFQPHLSQCSVCRSKLQSYDKENERIRSALFLPLMNENRRHLLGEKIEQFWQSFSLDKKNKYVHLLKKWIHYPFTIRL